MILQFGDCQLHPELFELRRAGQVQPVEPQVFDLLLYLARNNDRIISRAELLDTLWAGKVVTESTLSGAIKAARQALGDDAHQPQYIATYHRRGYRFVAAITQQAEVADASAGDSDSTMRNANIAAAAESGASCAFGVGVVGVKDRPVIAVLPFASGPADDEAAWVADVLSEDISVQLARIPGFFVLSRNTTAHYGKHEASIAQIANELGVDYVVEGSVWAIGDSLRIGVQLLSASSSNMLWSERWVIPVAEVGELQAKAVTEIVTRIEPELNRAELISLRQRRPVDLGAWALYRQARGLLGQKGWSEQTFAEVAELLRQAIERDTQLAFAHAYLALTLAIGHLVGLVNGDGWRAEATTAAETAIALDGQDTDVLGYVGCAFADMGDALRGIGMLRRAVELDPSNAQALAALGAALLQNGDEQGVDYMRQGMQVSPRDNRLSAWGALLARGLLNLGRTEEAIETATEACRCDDKIFLPRVVLAIAQFTAGNPQLAKLALADARRIRPNLSDADIGRFASPAEMELLAAHGILAQESHDVPPSAAQL